MVIEIVTTGSRVTISRGFLLINDGKVPIDDVEGVILATPAVTMSGQVMAALAARGVITVICGEKYMPLATVLPYSSHTEATRRVGFQAGADEKLKNNLWQQIIRQKIVNQSQLLANRRHTERAEQLMTLAKRVDADNPSFTEAHAARVYWRELFGAKFKREGQGGEGINAALNWGYMILRSVVARSLSLAGLYPSLGLHHHNRYNPMCLADDVMEPFRPLVDERVIALGDITDLTPDIKMSIAEVTKTPVVLNKKTYRADNAVRECINSLTRALEHGKGKLQIASLSRDKNAEPLSTGVDVLDV